MIYNDVVRVQEEIFSSSLRFTVVPQALYNQLGRVNRRLTNIELALQKSRRRTADDRFLRRRI